MFRSDVIYAMILIVQQREGKKGTFFSAVNSTKKKPERRWACRIGVTKYLKGVGAKYDASEFNFITVWDSNANKGEIGSRKYRQLNVNTLSYLKVAGKVLIEDRTPTELYEELYPTAASMAKVRRAV